LRIFQKFELSWLNPLFFGKIWVVPAQLDVFKRPNIAPKTPRRLVFQVWVEPAQPAFLTFGFSLDWSLDSAQLQKVREKWPWFLVDYPYRLWLNASGARRLCLPRAPEK